jgi:predicted N-acetyltransferase YhbS
MVTIRSAHAGDHARLRSLLLSAYLEYRDVLPAAAFAAYVCDLVAVERRADIGEILVAEHDGALVGTVTFYANAVDDGMDWPAGVSSVRAMAVPPWARDRGVGGALLAACVARAEQRGSGQLCLHTAPFMAAAVRMYEAAGFVPAPAYDIDVADRIPGTGDWALVISAFTRPVAAADLAA